MADERGEGGERKGRGRIWLMRREKKNRPSGGTYVSIHNQQANPFTSNYTNVQEVKAGYCMEREREVAKGEEYWEWKGRGGYDACAMRGHSEEVVSC